MCIPLLGKRMSCKDLPCWSLHPVPHSPGAAAGLREDGVQGRPLTWSLQLPPPCLPGFQLLPGARRQAVFCKVLSHPLLLPRSLSPCPTYPPPHSRGWAGRRWASPHFRGEALRLPEGRGQLRGPPQPVPLPWAALAGGCGEATPACRAARQGSPQWG